jgi:hypothetical protein
MKSPFQEIFFVIDEDGCFYLPKAQVKNPGNSFCHVA